MLRSFSRMLPELLRHSDRTDVFDRLPDNLKEAHRPRAVERDDAPAARPAPRAVVAAPVGLWDDDEDGLGAFADAGIDIGGDDDDDVMLLERAGF